MTIFDTENLSDLPPELIKELKLASDVDETMLALFVEAGGVLDLTTLLVGYYRKYGEVKTRQYMMTTCYRLVKKGFLQPTDNKGEYAATEKGRVIMSQKEKEEGDDSEGEQNEMDGLKDWL